MNFILLGQSQVQTVVQYATSGVACHQSTMGKGGNRTNLVVAQAIEMIKSATQIDTGHKRLRRLVIGQNQH
jgi:hypothetical protein